MIRMGMARVHQFDKDLCYAIIKMVVEDVPSTQERNNEDLEHQAATQTKQEELAKQKSLGKETDEYIEAMYLIDMCKSEVCIKGNPKNASVTLKKLKTERATYAALKINITIRAKGFGWDWAKTPWSKRGKMFTTSKLARKLHKFIMKENRRDISVEPEMNIPKRTSSGVLGTQTNLLVELDTKYLPSDVK